MPRVFSLPKLLAELPETLCQEIDWVEDRLEEGNLRVRCRQHQIEYYIKPGNLRRGQKGCPECANVGRAAARAARSSDIVAEALETSRAVHKGVYEYLSVPDKITGVAVIRCPVHGEFAQTLVSHSRGHGCAACASAARGAQRVAGVWDEYKRKIGTFCQQRGYVVVGGLGSPKAWRTPLTVECPEHGKFQSTVGRLCLGKGCWPCFVKYTAGKRVNADAAKGFLEKARGRHGDKYDYSKFAYLSAVKKSIVICRKHNYEFAVTPNGHLSGRGCPKCGIQMSVAEDELAEVLRSRLGESKVLLRDKEIIAPYHLDIVVPAAKLAIEYDGVYFHSTVNPKGSADRHMSEKSKLAARQGYRLIHVFESEYTNNKALVTRYILHAAGVPDQRREMARACSVVELAEKDSAPFFEENHLQGPVVRSGRVFGLQIAGETVAAMQFAPMRFYGAKIDQGALEMVRYATACSVVGGMSKLFTAALRVMKPRTVVTYSDNRWFSGDSYERLGFVRESFGEPSTIVVNKKLMTHVSRSEITHTKLKQKLGDQYDAMIPHKVLAYKAGYLILFDCGQSKWVWTRERNP